MLGSGCLRSPKGPLNQSQLILPSSLIIAWFHGGSRAQLHLRLADSGTPKTFCFASAAIAGPIPQPGAVSVSFDIHAGAFPSRGVIAQS